MNHSHNDVKQTVATSTIFWSQTRKEIPSSLLRSIVPMLVNGTKEKNTMVRVHSEQALITLLRLKAPESGIYQKCLDALDLGAVQSLEDCVVKIKKNLGKIDFKEEEFDDTLLF